MRLLVRYVVLRALKSSHFEAQLEDIEIDRGRLPSAKRLRHKLIVFVMRQYVGDCG